jgi:prolyl 4-hydroxylase
VTLGGSLPPDAIAKVQSDAAAGVAAASNLLATLTAAGMGVQQSWPDAMEHLARAASDGSASARGQLEALGSPSGLSSWMKPAAGRVLVASPRLVAVERFLTKPVCDWLIGLAKGRTQPARVYAPDGGAMIETNARSNSSIEFAPLNCDVVLLLTRARIAATIGVPAGALENSQVLHYEIGQQFTRHVDYLDPALPDVARRGQRIVTFLIYLNDDFEGGETEFPRLAMNHKGAPGDALYFANLDPASAPDPRTLHAGLPPTRGEKWLFSQWVRNRARS